MRKLRNIVIAGLVASGGLLLAQAPASAAEPSTPGAPTSVAPAPGDEQEVRAGCRYGGWFQFSDGRIVDIWICDEA